MFQRQKKESEIDPKLDKLLKNQKAVIVKQEINLIELVSRIEASNRYSVQTKKGQILLKADEISTFICRNCCVASRPLTLKLHTLDGEEVLRITRPYRCQSCFFPCCLQWVNVCSPIRVQIGYIKQLWNPFKPYFGIYSVLHERIYTIAGPICKTKMCGAVKFKIYANDGEMVGFIRKEWRGFFTEYLAKSVDDADIFELNFPTEAESIEKSLLLSLCFLLDFMYFERIPKKGRRICCCC